MLLLEYLASAAAKVWGNSSLSPLQGLATKSASKIDYHLRQLEKYGFVNLVEIRPHGNLHERVYAPVANEITVQINAEEPHAQLADAALGAVRREVLSMICQDVEEMTMDKYVGEVPSLYYSSRYLTPEEVETLTAQVTDLLGRYADRKPGAGLMRCNIAFMLATKSEVPK